MTEGKLTGAPIAVLAPICAFGATYVLVGPVASGSFSSATGAADMEGSTGCASAAGEEEGCEPSSAIPLAPIATPSGRQIDFAKSTVAFWSSGEQTAAIWTPTARRKADDSQMQVKSVSWQFVAAMPVVAAFCCRGRNRYVSCASVNG